MKPSSFALFVFCCSALLHGADSFEEGMRALAGRNYSTALSHMEEAITGDPDNIRFASEYRQAIISAGTEGGDAAGQSADGHRGVALGRRAVADLAEVVLAPGVDDIPRVRLSGASANDQGRCVGEMNPGNGRRSGSLNPRQREARQGK